MPTKKRHLEYSPHLITHIDILGFRELIKHEKPNFISRTIRKLIEATAPDNDFRKANQENYVKFSDLVIHSVPILPEATKKMRDGIVFQELWNMALAQADLVGEGVLIRGAVTIGELERTYGVLIGPGLIAAYDLEREQAQFPRIVIDPEVLRALKTTASLMHHPRYEDEIKYISDVIKRDDDGVVFIDYLGTMQTEGETADFLDFLSRHQQFIQKNITKFVNNKRVLSKYLWLKKYHNAIVKARLKRKFYKPLLVTDPESWEGVMPMTRAFDASHSED
jgi:hypothetical protein